MKKTRLALLCLLLLTATLLFSSCGEPSTVGFSKIFDMSKYSNSVLTTGTAVEALKNASDIHTSGVLASFTKTDENATSITKGVYNLETNSVVFQKTSSIDRPVSIDLLSMEYGTVILVTTSSTAPTEKTHRAIYTETGALIAEANGSTSCTVACDPLRFDNCVYRMAEDGSVALAFERSPLSTFPNVDAKVGNYYLETSFDDFSVTFFDSELNYVSTFDFPHYAEKTRGFVLSNGKLLMQYVIAETEDADSYTFIGTESIDGVSLTKGVKYTLKTLLYTPEKDTVKEIDFDRFLVSGISRTSDSSEWDSMGLSDLYDAFLVSYPISDKRIDASPSTAAYHVVDTDGTFSLVDFDMLGDEMLFMWQPIAQNRWIMETTTSTYLVNEKGEILGEVGNASMAGGYLNADSKLFDLNMELVFDYGASDLTRRRSFSGCVLLENEDQELFLYANGQKTKLIAKDSRRTLTLYPSSDYFVICDASMSMDASLNDVYNYELYNANGVKILV